MEYSAVILNGGKSSRSGVSNKALLKLGSKTVLEILYENLTSVFEDVIVISRDSEAINKLIPDAMVYPDIVESVGPLAGIYTGLTRVKHDRVFFCACDMPFIQKSLINELINGCDNYDIVCFKNDGRIEPLCAVYTKKCMPVIEQILRSPVKPSVIALLSRVDTRFIDLPQSESFFNINTPEDYEKAKMQFNNG
jgi:molybdopterin-guanine dinucleotide biosynthesis protein A